MNNVKIFTEKFLPLAKKCSMEYKLPYLAIIAQAALETGWGKYVKGNNYFGIKDSSLINEGVVDTKTHEYEQGEKKIIRDNFEGFASPESCFMFYGKFIHKRFPHALSIDNPVEYVTALQSKPKRVYATDPDYIIKIAKIIKMIAAVIDEEIVIDFDSIPRAKLVNKIKEKGA